MHLTRIIIFSSGSIICMQIQIFQCPEMRYFFNMLLLDTCYTQSTTHCRPGERRVEVERGGLGEPRAPTVYDPLPSRGEKNRGGEGRAWGAKSHLSLRPSADAGPGRREPPQSATLCRRGAGGGESPLRRWCGRPGCHSDLMQYSPRSVCPRRCLPSLASRSPRSHSDTLASSSERSHLDTLASLSARSQTDSLRSRSARSQVCTARQAD